jgi:hypothetical protein
MTITVGDFLIERLSEWGRLESLVIQGTVLMACLAVFGHENLGEVIEVGAGGQRRLTKAVRWIRSLAGHVALTICGGLHVPLPGGRMEGVSVFGQYRRITK